MEITDTLINSIDEDVLVMPTRKNFTHIIYEMYENENNLISCIYASNIDIESERINHHGQWYAHTHTNAPICEQKDILTGNFVCF